MSFYIKEFFNNPAGKGSSILNINATKQQYTQRYDKIVKQINQRIFIVKKDIYFLINIPSSVNGIMYDILVKFEPTSKSTGVGIDDMSMTLFSNSPSFLYTYANAYDKQRLFIRECKRKLSNKMLNDIAKTKNPYGVLSYDFSIFCALNYIISNEYTKIDTIKELGKNASRSEVINLIKNADSLQKERKLQKDYNKLIEEELNEKKNKVKYNSSKDKNEEDNKNIKDVKDTKKVKNVKKTKKVSKTKRK